ncbi:hypothetical protein [Ruoffia tabacinasalis]|uniref:hypothetical protein n=1 Tax=Ruoffia tabacinasalis TaxID=87458 RepID=UPI0030CAEC0D
MNQKLKIVSLSFAIMLLSASIFFNITTVYATENEQQTQEYTEVEIVEPTSLSLTEVEINSLANEIQALHPSVSKEWIIEVIYKQLQGDYSLQTEYTSSQAQTRSSWQGITVDQMGAALDTAIALALGGSTVTLANLIKVKGKYAAKSAICSAIAKYLGSWVVNDVVLEFAMNLLSPGTYLAQLWDENDAVPNNGRINF